MRARHFGYRWLAGFSFVMIAALDPGVRADLAGGNWPQWRGPQRDGVSTETGLLTSWPQGGPKRLFMASGLGRGFSSVAVTGGRIYTMGDRRDGQYVLALDEETGKQIWATRIGGVHEDPDGFGGARGTPTIDGELLYAIGTDGSLVCLESATGRERWRKNLERDFDGRMMSQWRWAESPLVDGDRVVVTPGGPRAGIVALEKATGKEIWRAAIPRIGPAGADGAAYSSIVISNGGGVKQYVQVMGRGIVGVRASDGWYMWGNNAIANDIANISTPVVRDNYVFASTGYGTGSVMLEISPAPNGRATAKQKYFLDAGVFQSHHGGFVIVGDHIYGGHGHNAGLPACIELATGKSIWPRARNSGTGSAAVVAADGHLYFRYQNGVVLLVEATPTGYKEKGSLQIPNPYTVSWPHPVVTGGRLYVREQDALHVYDVRR
ncbi:MAG TPA: PQQ-binding-like beta-propeller repeat protein [Vicinamibacterales bacterium]|nr:PQQ-binding-like beta-propeller repeat protein [Vicinamibacterales bacterium]